VGIESLVPNRRTYARAANLRASRCYRTSSELTRSELEQYALPITSPDRLSTWNHPVYARRPATEQRVAKADQALEAAAELEFGEGLRSPRFPAGWFVLPSALLSILLLLGLLH